MRVHQSAVLVLLGLVAACGNGDNSSPSPSPTPSSTTTPTPTPSSSISVPPGCPGIPADKGQPFDQIVTGIGAAYPSGDRLVVYNPTEVSALYYNASNDAYVFIEPDPLYFTSADYSGSSILTPSDIDAANSNDTVQYRKNSCSPSSNYQHSLEIYKQNSSGSTIHLTYSSIGTYLFFNNSGLTTSSGNAFHFAIGSPTPQGSIPSSGLGSFSGTLIGRGYTRSNISSVTYDLSGTVTTQVDYDAKTFKTQLHITGVDTSNKSIDLGTFSFDNVGDPGLSRLKADGNGGSVLGFLSGPAAQELVFSFTIKSQITVDGVPVDIQMAGSAAETK